MITEIFALGLTDALKGKTVAKAYEIENVLEATDLVLEFTDGSRLTVENPDATGEFGYELEG